MQETKNNVLPPLPGEWSQAWEVSECPAELAWKEASNAPLWVLWVLFPGLPSEGCQPVSFLDEGGGGN